MRKLTITLAAGMLILASLACTIGTPSVEQILADTADALSKVETVGFFLDFEDLPVALDPQNDISLLSLEGVYRAPDDVFVTARIEVAGAITEADILWIPDDIYMRIPGFQPDFEAVDIEAEFDPSDLFADDGGFPELLREGISEAELIGEEDVDGVATYHVRGLVHESDIADVFGPEFDDGDGEDEAIQVDLWVNKDTNLIVKMELTGSDGTWSAEFYDYGEDVDIPEP